eukprot:UN05287
MKMVSQKIINSVNVFDGMTLDLEILNSQISSNIVNLHQLHVDMIFVLLFFNVKITMALNLYKTECSKIQLINDEQFGGNKCQLYIYGYPGDKRSHKKEYYLYVMGTSQLDAVRKFIVRKNEMNKFYIVNKSI